MSEAFSVLEILEQLYRRGYTEDFRVIGQNMRLIPANVLIDPEYLIVDDIYRFEGYTDLGDEAVIFALSCPKNNLKGTYLVAYGPMMDIADSHMVQKLSYFYPR